MSWRVINLPNGLLGRYSDEVGMLTFYNVNRAGMIHAAFLELGNWDEARAKVMRGVRDEPVPGHLESSGRGDGLDRWRDCLEKIRARHGMEVARGVERDGSKAVESSPGGEG